MINKINAIEWHDAADMSLLNNSIELSNERLSTIKRLDLDEKRVRYVTSQ